MSSRGDRRRGPRLGSAALLALLSLLLPVFPAAAEDARELLLRSLEPRVAGYTGVQVSEVMEGPARRPIRQQVYRKGGTLRVNYAGGQVLFDDGRTQYFYQPRQNAVEKSPSRLTPDRTRTQREMIRKGRATVELVGEDTVAGRAAYVLAVQAPRGSRRKVWVDRQTYVQLRQDTTSPNGRTVSTYFTEINFQAIPADAVMAFTPPAGARIVERGPDRPLSAEEAAEVARAWGGLLTPRVVPAGYRFRGYYRHQYRGRDWLVAVYAGPPADGRRAVLSFFQGPAVGSAGMVERKKHLRVLSARRGPAEITLVGPIPEDELQRMMDSVGQQ